MFNCGPSNLFKLFKNGYANRYTTLHPGSNGLSNRIPSALAISSDVRIPCGNDGNATLAIPHQDVPINTHETHFDKLLIANRGEIACRIIRTARDMGIYTIAVHSSIDIHSKHVHMADESVLIGGPKPCESYLNIERIIQAAHETKAQAIHPGYGFLAENYKFVELLEKEKLIFVGPSAKCIRQMGDKLQSKQIAAAAGIPTIPGYNGIVDNLEHCLEIARELGYPVMIKASAGGGGRGMRIAWSDQDAREGYELASAEAQIAFGDQRLLIEKHLDNARHIELQVLADKFGNVVHLYERECSLQRRHQKIIEECPSTFLDPNERNSLGTQAVNLCKSINYHSAGTVEFLVDSNKNCYFLEMNTRLQVEHPLTECITEIDIVEQMIKIAQGDRLNLQQKDITIQGWAIESRVYAEDPCKNFGTPSTGRIFKYHEPPQVRCDSGVEEGDLVSIYYDPLLAKVIVHESNRCDAIKASKEALDRFILRGVTTNIPLLRDILCQKGFVCGDFNTSYLLEIYNMHFSKFNVTKDEETLLIANAVGIYANEEIRRIQNQAEKEWDLVIKMPEGYFVEGGKDKYFVKAQYENSKDTIKLKINNGEWFTHKIKFDGLVVTGTTEDKDNDVFMQFGYKKPDGSLGIIFKGALYEFKILPKVAHELLKYVTVKRTHQVSKELRAPMPGLMKTVNCKEGQLVHEGEVLCVIEAMKMQNTLNATTQGRVKKIHFDIGDRVAEEEVLIEME